MFCKKAVTSAYRCDIEIMVELILFNSWCLNEKVVKNIHSQIGRMLLTMGSHGMPVLPEVTPKYRRFKSGCLCRVVNFGTNLETWIQRCSLQKQEGMKLGSQRLPLFYTPLLFKTNTFLRVGHGVPTLYLSYVLQIWGGNYYIAKTKLFSCSCRPTWLREACNFCTQLEYILNFPLHCTVGGCFRAAKSLWQGWTRGQSMYWWWTWSLLMITNTRYLALPCPCLSARITGRTVFFSAFISGSCYHSHSYTQLRKQCCSRDFMSLCNHNNLSFPMSFSGPRTTGRLVVWQTLI